MPTQDENNSAMLARIDERTTALLNTVAAIEKKLSENYVTQDEFRPVKAIVYGLVSILLVVVVGALVTLVIKK